MCKEQKDEEIKENQQENEMEDISFLQEEDICIPIPPEQPSPEEEAQERLEKLHLLEDKLDYHFNNIDLLQLALTHKSFIIGDGNYLECNERMEFLGDSVLALVVNSFLYNNFPEYDEGQLSKLKAVAVSRSTLATCAKEMDLGSFIRFGAGELASGGSDKSSNLANALEALIAAVYLDGGLEKAEKFIFKILKDTIYELDSDELKRDYKTALQEYWQASSQRPPVYSVIAETGPDHNKRFEVVVKLAGEPYGRGIGRNKKEAEQKAAENALEVMFDRRREEVTSDQKTVISNQESVDSNQESVNSDQKSEISDQ